MKNHWKPWRHHHLRKGMGKGVGHLRDFTRPNIPPQNKWWWIVREMGPRKFQRNLGWARYILYILWGGGGGWRMESRSAPKISEKSWWRWNIMNHLGQIHRFWNMLMFIRGHWKKTLFCDQTSSNSMVILGSEFPYENSALFRVGIYP